MDSRGNLYRADEVFERLGINEGFFESQKEFMSKMLSEKLIPLTEPDYQELAPLSKNARKNNMRNKPCICGSSKKFKKFCWGKFE